MSDEWDKALQASGTNNSSNSKAGGSTESPKPLFPTVEEWVLNWLAPTIRRPAQGNQVWCPRWWAHAEGICRLDALWRAWEALRLDGTTGMSVWWRDHFDYHMTVLQDPQRSPFGQCRDGHTDDLEPLQVMPAPPGTWDAGPT
uniref:DUF4913 domain-containing protein n=1 Tax=Amycolatopsis sp. CA-151526 TaxID=3239921 RepID=UPI003F4921DC